MTILKRAAVAAAIIVALVFSAGLLAALGGDGVRTTNQAAADSPDAQHAITVSGDGSVLAKPDTAHVTLGVQIQNAELSAAQSQASDQMNAVLASLKQSGISDDNIKTVNYSINVNQDYSKGTGEVTGYTVINMVDVKITDIDKLGAIIDAAVKAGANNVGGVQFSVENMDALVQQAREQAMADAKSKAEQLAKLGGVTLGAPVSISEGTSMPPQPMAARDAMSVASGAAAAPIQTGQNEITVSVTVSYGF
jgi:uncharacterized protein YggE